MFRSRSWFGWNRPKNRLSLEHLKYLYGLLEKNASVSETNRGLLVESLRSIAEILIWGDQHDSSVFDFFLEKNMLSYFLHIMRQKSGGSSFVCVQLLQTLNILFENIRNETSLYYLLSNNHVNSIIVHKFDFSDEDVMGYYILFLKTLSLKLNVHTIHFFYNEHTNDFPLYTEAIKFFNHPESMVRIAVRTISLNVYKVQNTSMLRFIRNRTAAPYFSNMVWFIGKHILELDVCVRTDIDHQSFHKLSNLVAEHMDHLHYLNDILLLEINDLNAVLSEHLLHKLFVPLYIFSLTPAPATSSLAMITQNLAAVLNRNVMIDATEMNHPRISSVVALYLLSLVFLVVAHGPLVHALAWVILNGDHSVFIEGAAKILNDHVVSRETIIPVFAQPRESLEEALHTISGVNLGQVNDIDDAEEKTSTEAQVLVTANITDEEKQKLRTIAAPTELRADNATSTLPNAEDNRPFLNLLITTLDCSENDYVALLGLCLLHSMALNRGIKNDWFEQVLSQPYNSSLSYKNKLIECLLQLITLSNQPSCRIRLVTIEIALELLIKLSKTDCIEKKLILSETYQNQLFLARNQSMLGLRTFYKSEDIFLDLFEDEFNEICKSQLNIEFLCMDSTILLPPTGTPLTGINFTRRLPCGEVEKARRAIRLFFLLRRTCQKLLDEEETLLPLTKQINLVCVEQVLDLNNSDLIGCSVITKDGIKQRRFLVIDSLQLILVEPDAKLLGWGVAKFVGFLQDIEVLGDKDDSRCLHITVHRGGATHNRTPLLSAKFVFDDHIRCMAAKQRLTKGRSKARQKKMYQIAQLIEMPGQIIDTSIYALSGLATSGNINQGSREQRLNFTGNHRVPGFAAALRRDTSTGVSRVQIAQNRSIENVRNENARGRTSRRRSSNSSTNCTCTQQSTSKLLSRSGSPYSDHKSPSISPRNSSNSSPTINQDNILHSEEIPLEYFQHSRNNSPQARAVAATFSSNATFTPSRKLNEHTKLYMKEEIDHETIARHSKQQTMPDSDINCAAKAKDTCQLAGQINEETSFIGEETPSSSAIFVSKNGVETV